MNTNENATFLQSEDEQQNPPTVETLSETDTYYYAVLDDNDIVTEVISSPFPAPESYTQYIQIDSLDETLVGKWYDRENGTFTDVPALTCDTENVSYNGTSMRLNTKLDNMDALIAANTEAKHTHDNKDVLDGITADKVSAWDAGTGSTVDAYTKTESDAKYALIGASYTKAESDAKYALAGSSGATMTATEILTAIKTVDGTESGLDADTLDGKHASEFAFSNHSHAEYAAATHTHDGYASTDHTHTGYAAASHSHGQADITGLEDALSGKASSGHTHTEYAASSHNHAQSDITGLETALAGKASSTHSHSEYAASDHTHTGYAASNHTHDDYAAADHTHTGYAATNHTHSDYAAAEHSHTGYAASSHTHGQADITGLENALAGKADADHSHTGYAAENHTHTEYAASDHSHTGYATSDHSHELSGLSGTLPISKGGTGATTAAAALSALGAAASGHSHSGYAASNHTHSGYASSNHTHSGYAASDHTHSQYSLSGHSHTTNGSCEFTGNIRTRDVFSAADGTYNLGAYSNRYKFVYSSNQLQVPSDARMKEEILNTSRAELMDFLRNLHVITYKYKGDKEKKERIGLIAQEMQNASTRLSEYFLNKDEETGMLSLSAADLVFPLIAAVQMLSEQVEMLLNK